MANPTMASGQKPHGGTDSVRRTPAANAGTATARTEGRTAGKWAMRHPRRATPTGRSHLPRSGSRFAAHVLGCFVVPQALVTGVAEGGRRSPLTELDVAHQ